MKTAVAVTILIALAMGFSMRESVAGTPTMWLGLGLPYLLLSAVALRRMYLEGTLLDVMRPRAGDPSIGIVLGGVLVGAGYIAKHLLFGEASPKIAWLYRIALEFGVGRPSWKQFAAIAGIAALEELVWRGLVQRELSDSLGDRRGWPVAAGLYAAAHLPTVFTLADPEAGKNPLVVLAALGCGMVWGFATSLLGRLPPIMISHVVFTYFAASVLLPRFG